MFLVPGRAAIGLATLLALLGSTGIARADENDAGDEPPTEEPVPSKDAPPEPAQEPSPAPVEARPTETETEAETAATAELPPKGDRRSPARKWLFLSVRQDFTWASGSKVCSPNVQRTGEFACFRGDGVQYLGTPRPEDRANVGPGFLLATTRLTVSYSHFVLRTLALEGSVGWVVRGGSPRSVGEVARDFLPLHLEAKAAYFPWGPPARTGGLAPFVAASVGVAQTDGHFQVAVREDTGAPRPAGQLDNPDAQALDVYVRRGTGFAGGGLGLVAAVGHNILLRAAATATGSFPAGGFGTSLELGVGYDL